jgi:hypothetical protein
MTKVFLTVPFIILNDYYVETSSIYLMFYYAENVDH